MTSAIQPPNQTTTRVVHPTLLLCYGDVFEVNPLLLRVRDRLQAYVEAGVVQTITVESGDDVQHVVLPEYDAWLGIDNLYRYSVTNDDKWADLQVTVKQINVLVVVLDQLADSADLQQLHQHVLQQYAGRGVDVISIALLWHTEHPAPSVPLAYTPQLAVHPRRVRDAMATIEHAMVNWVTAGMLDYIEQQSSIIRGQSQRIDAIWLGASGIYVDEAYSMRAFFDRMVMHFMQAWQTPPIDVRTDEVLRHEALSQARAYVAGVSQTILRTLHAQGWRLRSDDVQQYEQTSVQAGMVSGVPHPDTTIAQEVFGKAAPWWLGAQTPTPSSLLGGLVQRFRVLLVARHETLLPTTAEMQHALTKHYQTVNIECQSAMMHFHEITYVELQQFFVRQLADVHHSAQGGHGLKRMIAVMEKYIAQLEAVPRMTIHDHYADKSTPVHVVSALNADDVATYAATHTTLLQQLKQKWSRDYAGLISFGGMAMRLLVTFPMILSLFYAIWPSYFLTDYFLTATIIATSMLVLGTAYIVYAYSDYFSNIERERDTFFAERMTPFVLSMAAHWSEVHRQQLLTRLRRLCVVYQDIESKVQQSHTYVPIAVDNINTPARFVVRRLDRVFGTSQEVVDGRFRGFPWDAVRHETVWCYTAEQQLWLSWMSEIKAHLNVIGEYPAEVTMLQQMVANVFQQRREAATGIVFLKEQIAKYVPDLMKRDPIALEVLVESVPELQAGRKWVWLQRNAQVDVVPRNTTGIHIIKKTLLVLSVQGVEALVGFTGYGNALYQPVDCVLTTHLPHEMIRLEFEFDVK